MNKRQKKKALKNRLAKKHFKKAYRDIEAWAASYQAPTNEGKLEMYKSNDRYVNIEYVKTGFDRNSRKTGAF